MGVLSYGDNSSSQNFIVQGHLIDYYTNNPVTDARIILADTATQNGTVINHDLLVRSHDLDESGRFAFFQVRDGVYEMWLDDRAFQVELAPQFQLNEINSGNLILFLKDNELISCQALNPPLECANISGTVFYDENSNCEFDPEDEPSIDHIIEITPGPFYVDTDTAGKFSVNLIPGTYSVNASLSQYLYTNEICMNGEGYDFVLEDSLDFDLNFGYTFIQGIEDLEIYANLISNRIRPGRDFNYQLNYRNYGTTPLDARIVLSHPTYVTLEQFNVTPTNVYVDSLIWALGELQPLEEGIITLKFDLAPDPNLIGTILKMSSYISPFVNDSAILNNFDSTLVEILGPFDPNDKMVIPAGEGDFGNLIVDQVDHFDYNIRFQNVGTDTAFKVVIIDTIDTDLDLLTLDVVAASHPYNLSIRDRRLQFTFEDINLVDSTTNEPGSHGFIRYVISPQNVEIGDVFKNKAGIYFDFNPPIITNEVVNTIVDEIVAIKELSTSDDKGLILFPNPSSNKITIGSASDFHPNETFINCVDPLGNLVFAKKVENLPLQISINHFSKGIYIINLISPNGIKSKLLMKN